VDDGALLNKIFHLYANGRESVVNRVLDGSTYSG